MCSSLHLRSDGFGTDEIRKSYPNQGKSIKQTNGVIPKINVVRILSPMSIDRKGKGPTLIIPKTNEIQTVVLLRYVQARITSRSL